MSATAVSVEQERIAGMVDAKLQAAAQKKLDAKLADSKPDQTTELPAPGEWTALIAQQVAALLMSGDNLIAAKTLCAMLAPWITLKFESQATPVVPVAPPTLAVPIGSNGSLVRQVA